MIIKILAFNVKINKNILISIHQHDHKKQESDPFQLENLVPLTDEETLIERRLVKEAIPSQFY